MTKEKIKTLFCDIGGVILTNGWDRKSREKAAKDFNFDLKEFDGRHQLIFGDYECGRISLDDYLRYTVFFEPRAFTVQSFKDFMFDQSQPKKDMLELVKSLKATHKLKLVLLSNEGRELTNHRLSTFGLDKLADFFVISCFAGIKKPDHRIFRMAIDMSNTPPGQIAYLDDRQLFVEIAGEMGVHGIHHQDINSTKTALETLFKV